MLIVGGAHCLPCRQLETFLKQNRPQFTKHFFITRIDIDAMTNGSEVHERFRNLDDALPSYIPFTVILGADGQVLATSGEMDGPIGLPMAGDADRAAYLAMLRKTAEHMTDDEIVAIDSAAIEFRQTLGVK